MPKITDKQFAQPYVGSVDEMRAFLNPVRTVAQVTDIADTINTEDKYIGKQVFVSDAGGTGTTGQIFVAVGATAGALWSDPTGATAANITPV